MDEERQEQLLKNLKGFTMQGMARGELYLRRHY